MIAIVTEKVLYEQKDYGSKNIDAHYLTQTKKSMFVQHLHSITRVYMFVFILLLALLLSIKTILFIFSLLFKHMKLQHINAKVS